MSEERLSIDVIIPVYRPDARFFALLRMLARQDRKIGKLILMNTEEALFGEEAKALLVSLSGEENAIGEIELHHLKKTEFDHAATRARAVSFSSAEYFVCMTDDAVPADERLLSSLYAGFSMQMEEGEAPPAAMSYARQLAAEDCREAERFTRSFNYPEQSYLKQKKDLGRLGIKTYFASNVCCMYRRSVYEKLGGFCAHAVFNEDMLYAAKAVNAGYAVAYRADAKVIHSHNYTGRQQFHRNFDLGMSQSMHPEVFAGLPSEGEGLRLVKRTAAHLLKQRDAAGLFGLFRDTACKYAGYRLGKAYRRLPYPLRHACAMNKTYVELHRQEKEGEKAI